jgi:transcriptional regulator with XRE-family HTH domain/tetratricopeptide (TPR) repeat protein
MRGNVGEGRQAMATVRVLSFADVLKRYRMAAGLTQEELAERAGLSPKGISDLERGARRNPRRETVALLAEALTLSDRDRATLEAAARQRVPPSNAPSAPSAPATRHPTSPLVGREREMTLLREHLAGDAPALLLVAGEPGIGKSRLLREAARYAAEQGWAVLAGGCHRRSGQEPYAPFLATLAARLAAQSPRERKAALRGCAWLVRLLPELAEDVAPPSAVSLAPDQERRLAFAAVARHLANASGPAGTLLILDDLQWAGEDALDLLAYLARSPAERPLRVVGAYRDTDIRADDLLGSLVADLAREGLLVRAALAPLAAAAAEELLDALLAEQAASPDGVAPSGPDAASLRAKLLLRTGGVPFFLVSCVRGMRGMRGMRDGAAATAPMGEVPWTVAETIRQRLAALPEAARTLLDAAAIVGRETPRSLLLEVAELPRRDVALAALDVAVRARLLDEVGDHAYAFPHDLEREVVWADLGSARRAALHRRVARALETRGAERSIEALAYHYARAADDHKAVAYLEQAGDRALARFAASEAERYYRDAVEWQGATLTNAAKERAARMREKLADALTALARYDEARAALESSIASYRAEGDPAGLARATAQLGRIYARGGPVSEGLERVWALLTEFEGVDGVLSHANLAALHESLAWLFDAEGRWDEALTACERAAEYARAADDARLIARVEMLRGGALLSLGRMDESMAVLAALTQAEAPSRAAGG